MLNSAFVFLICLFSGVVVCQQLLMVQETFRHGARYPIFIEKADGSEFATQQHSIGQLTTQGKNMHYLFGKIIYQKYWGQLFTATPFYSQYNQSQFFVKSTDVNRTIQSAQSHLFGLFENLPALQLGEDDYQHSLPAWNGPESQGSQNVSAMWDVFRTGPSFHPVPIHVQKKWANEFDNGDFLRAYDRQSCPNQDFWSHQNWNSKEVLEYTNNAGVQAAVSALSKAVGKTVDVKDAYKWIDTKNCQEYLNLPYLPVFENSVHKKYFKFLEVISMYTDLFAQPDQIRAVSTLYLQQTLENLKGKVNGTYTPRMVIYSAHDTTVGMVLAALNMTNLKCIANYYLNNIVAEDTCVEKFPPFTANIIFQLWNKKGAAYIKILYNGQARKIPICDYLYECPLSKFEKWVQEFSVQDYHKACGMTQSNKTFYVIIFILIGVILVLGLVIVFLKRNSISPRQDSGKDGYDVQLDEKVVEQ